MVIKKKLETPGSDRIPSRLAAAGQTPEDIFGHLEQIAFDKVKGHWSIAFRASEDVQRIGQRAYQMFLSDNGIFSLYVPYIKNIEQELMDMCAGLFNAPSQAVANMTSGGSESIYCAIHAAREWAKAHKPHIQSPVFISPYSGHATLTKACHYLDVELVRTPLNKDLRPDLDAIRGAIDENTIGIYASAPCWPYGLIDPVEDMGEIAEQHDLWLHVDACVGGYLLPFMERIGFELPRWDFRVPAVRSISADLHKYAYCPKPASTVIWRDDSLLEYHYVQVTTEDWPTGPYVTSAFLGSRSAGPIFASWAVMKYLGLEGYERLTRHVMDVRERLSEGIDAIPGIRTRHCDALPLPFGPAEDDGVDLTVLATGMSQRGWILLGTHKPPLINVPIDAATDDTVIDTFLGDLRATVADIRSGKLHESSDLRYG